MYNLYQEKSLLNILYWVNIITIREMLDEVKIGGESKWTLLSA
jgi:hypothetical protein